MKTAKGYQDGLFSRTLRLIILVPFIGLAYPAFEAGAAWAQFKGYSTSTSTGKSASGSSSTGSSSRSSFGSYQRPGGGGNATGFGSYQRPASQNSAAGGFGTYQRPSGAGFGNQGVNPNFGGTRVNPQGFGHGQAKGAGHAVSPGGVYSEFKSPHGVIRWLSGQMPLKIWVSKGLAIDAIMDPKLGAPVANVENLAKWPDLVAELVSDPRKLHSLPVAKGYDPAHRAAVLQGINSWKRFESEGLFSYQISEEPQTADIHVFFVNHFVNSLAMALFANDIRGYTAKRSFPYQAIVAKKQIPFRPVVIVLRCTDKAGNPIAIPKMQAAAAHEMGHALGIEGHSPNSGDLMSIYYGNGTVSSGDAATIRYLYGLTPDLVP